MTFMKDSSLKRTPQTIFSETFSISTNYMTNSTRRIRHLNEIQIARTMKINEQPKRTHQYDISQLLELKKYNELVYVKCSFSDVIIQQDCILSFKMHDLHDENVFVLGKYWSQCKVSELIHQHSCIVLGKLKHLHSSSSLVSSSVQSKKKDRLVFECVWISLGKENEL